MWFLHAMRGLSCSLETEFQSVINQKLVVSKFYGSVGQSFSSFKYSPINQEYFINFDLSRIQLQLIVMHADFSIPPSTLHLSLQNWAIMRLKLSDTSKIFGSF